MRSHTPQCISSTLFSAGGTRFVPQDHPIKYNRAIYLDVMESHPKTAIVWKPYTSVPDRPQVLICWASLPEVQSHQFCKPQTAGHTRYWICGFLFPWVREGKLESANKRIGQIAYQLFLSMLSIWAAPDNKVCIMHSWKVHPRYGTHNMVLEKTKLSFMPSYIFVSFLKGLLIKGQKQW